MYPNEIDNECYFNEVGEYVEHASDSECFFGVIHLVSHRMLMESYEHNNAVELVEGVYSYASCCR
jgi:hypothetical protein